MEATEVGRTKQCGRGEARMDGKRGRTARGGRASPPLVWPREETEGELCRAGREGGGGGVVATGGRNGLQPSREPHRTVAPGSKFEKRAASAAAGQDPVSPPRTKSRAVDF